MQNEKEEQPREEPLLNRLVERARSKFLEQETYIDIKSGVLDPYGTYLACGGAITESGLDPISLLPELIRSTNMPPYECLTVVDNIDKKTTWREVCQTLAEKILSEELISKYPEIEEEEKRRFEIYAEF